MINFDYYTIENKTEHNSKWPYIPDYPFISIQLFVLNLDN